MSLTGIIPHAYFQVNEDVTPVMSVMSVIVIVATRAVIEQNTASGSQYLHQFPSTLTAIYLLLQSYIVVALQSMQIHCNIDSVYQTQVRPLNQERHHPSHCRNKPCTMGLKESACTRLWCQGVERRLAPNYRHQNKQHIPRD